jgi:hypothetical protein
VILCSPGGASSGDDPRTTAGGYEDSLGDALAGELRRYVNRAVSDPDDEDALAGEVEGVLRIDVVVGVDRLAVEAAGGGPGAGRV